MSPKELTPKQFRKMQLAQFDTLILTDLKYAYGNHYMELPPVENRILTFPNFHLGTYLGRKSDLKDFDYEQMKLGKLYLQKGITKENSSLKGKEKAEEINNTAIGNRDEIVRLEREMIGKSGNELYIPPSVYVSYGFNIEVGENFYANKDCIFMDTNSIKFGDNVIVGPRCCFYCAIRFMAV